MIAAATSQWLGWLAEYDRRRGWAVWGCKSAAHWLSYTCGMSLRTARDHVRVARGLEQLPIVRAAFAAGGLSFSKTRALTRIERPIDEEAMVELARATTAAELDRLVAGHRQIDRSGTSTDGSAEPPIDDGGWSKRRYQQRDRPDGMVQISLVVPADVAKMIDTAIEARVEEALTPGEPDPDTSVRERVAERGGWPAVRADAAIELLGGSAEPSRVELDIDLTITAAADSDPSGLADLGEIDPTDTATLVTGARLPTEVTRRYGCDGSVRLTATNHSTGGDGDTPSIGVGRRTKVVPRWLRRRLERRDNYTCQFPSCASTRRLHAHHIVHWADFGPTDLDNLLLLCSFHHHLVHEGGWQLTGTATDHVITRPDGTPLDPQSLPDEPDTTSPPDLDASAVADTGGLIARSGAGDRYDHNYVVDVAWSINDNHRKRFRGTVPEQDAPS